MPVRFRKALLHPLGSDARKAGEPLFRRPYNGGGIGLERAAERSSRESGGEMEEEAAEEERDAEEEISARRTSEE